MGILSCYADKGNKLLKLSFKLFNMKNIFNLIQTTISKHINQLSKNP